MPGNSAYLQTKHSGWNFLNIAVMQRSEIGLRHIAHVPKLEMLTWKSLSFHRWAIGWLPISLFMFSCRSIMSRLGAPPITWYWDSIIIDLQTVWCQPTGSSTFRPSMLKLLRDIMRWSSSVKMSVKYQNHRTMIKTDPWWRRKLFCYCLPAPPRICSRSCSSSAGTSCSAETGRTGFSQSCWGTSWGGPVL